MPDLCDTLLLLITPVYRAAAETVRGVRQSSLPSDSDTQGCEGAPKAVSNDAERGSRRQIYADHYASAGVSG